MNKVMHVVSFACLAFSIIGFIETALGFKLNNSYNLLKTIVYCLLFGVGLALVN